MVKRQYTNLVYRITVIILRLPPRRYTVPYLAKRNFSTVHRFVLRTFHVPVKIRTKPQEIRQHFLQQWQKEPLFCGRIVNGHPRNITSKSFYSPHVPPKNYCWKDRGHGCGGIAFRLLCDAIFFSDEKRKMNVACNCCITPIECESFHNGKSLPRLTTPGREKISLHYYVVFLVTLYDSVLKHQTIICERFYTGWPKSASDPKTLSKNSLINLLRKFQMRLHSWSITTGCSI